MKADKKLVVESYSVNNVLARYEKAVSEIGLWNSEKVIFSKYFQKNFKILDMGCGTGRTTFGLHALGFQDIVGIDLTPAMIEAAQKKQLLKRPSPKLIFQVGDACAIDFKEATFDACLFSFNGLMQIPNRENRLKAMQEIFRVLKPGGFFIFTTHDRAAKEYRAVWEAEQRLWENGKADPRLYEFGDKIISIDGVETFLHFPTRNGIFQLLAEANFIHLEDAWNFELASEPEHIKKNISDCRFWVALKPGNTTNKTSFSP